jgi:AcrR family transcriptional regulator
VKRRSQDRHGQADDTRQRILDVAQDLFARQGYTGTTIADIARPLGITTAALYYHFKSKADILESLLAEPLAAYTRLIERATEQRLPADALLSAYIDFIAETRELIPVIAADPAARAMVDERLPRTPQETTETIVSALTGPHPGRSALIHAHAALAVVKEGTLMALAGGERLTTDDRDDILAAALGALGHEGPSAPAA